MPKSKAPAQTFQEATYLRHLTENDVRICVKLEDGEEHRGVIEFWDAGFIRLNRDDGAKLFIYKHDIRYFYELDEG